MADFQKHSLRGVSRSTRSPAARLLRYEPLEDRRMLAVVTVTTDQDVVDFNDGLTSLREAIFATNLVEGADEIRFDFGHDGPATILLTEGKLRINDSLKILGGGRDLLTIDAQQESVIFETFSFHGQTPTVTIEELTLTGGSRGAIYSTANLTIRNSSLRNNSYLGGSGGAIIAYGGTLKVENSLITDNSATFNGGGIMAAAPITIIESNIERNIAAKGGGVYVRAPDLFLVASVSVTGDLDFRGGDDSLATSKINNSTIVNNTANSGGGLWVATYAELAITATTISGNSATDGVGGGVGGKGGIIIRDSLISDNNSSSKGGGIGVLRNTVVVDNSTIVENSTITGNEANDGGGLYVHGKAEISGSTITNNVARRTGGGLFVRAGTVSISHTIVANNAGVVKPDLAGFVGASHSIIGFYRDFRLPEAPIGSPDANGNLIGGPAHGIIDPMLGDLADNGGPTQTHALLPGSPAINAGDLNALAGVDDIPLFDQRGEGFRRIFSRIDIGAYEVQELGDLNLLVDTLVDESDGDFRRGDLSLREAIELANANPVPDTIRFDPIFTALAGPLPATILLTEGELAITDSVEIVGLGADQLTIDAQQNSRIFNIDDHDAQTFIDVSVSGVKLTRGSVHEDGGAIFSAERLVVEDAILADNSADRGGAISSEQWLAIRSTTLADNRAVGFGGALYFNGNGIFNATASQGPVFEAFLEVSQSSVLENSARIMGGGIWANVQHGRLALHDNEIRGNLVLHDTSVAGRGGGIFAELTNVQATIVGNEIVDNSAAVGGGIAAITASGETTIADSAISGNTATLKGGGIYLRGDNQNGSVLSSRVENNVAGLSGGGIYSGFGGQLRVANSTIRGNASEHQGGGIYGRSRLTVEQSEISDNSADSGGGIYSRGVLEIDRSTISGNSTLGNEAFADGAGLFVSGGTVDIHDSLFADNTAVDRAGAARFLFTVATIERTTFRSNESLDDWGGAIHSSGSEVTIDDSTFYNNRADGWSGAIHNEDFRRRDAVMTITGSTLSGNSADRGGGISNHNNGELVIRHSTLTDNHARATGNSFGTGGGGGVFADTGTVLLDHTIVAGNSRGAVPTTPDDIDGQSPVVFTADFSLIQVVSPGTPLLANATLIGFDPQLGPLADNGGSTLTHALLFGSPAMDAGDPDALPGAPGVPEFDQRGNPFTRIFGGRIDIGAFEVQPIPGDFDHDGDSDGDDRAQWESDFGLNGNSDSNGDGDSDGGDFLNWQRTFGTTIAAPVVANGHAPVQPAVMVTQNRAALSAKFIDLAIAVEFAADAPFDRPSVVEIERSIYLLEETASVGRGVELLVASHSDLDLGNDASSQIRPSSRSTIDWNKVSLDSDVVDEVFAQL